MDNPSPKSLFQRATFLQSAQKPDQCPADEGLEVAFAGRSNAGKSSALNRLTGQKKLARTSKTPGRTQLINFFALDTDRRLVDLPGYGYAKVAKHTKMQWQQHLQAYLEQRQSLAGLVLLMDVRHPLQPFDEAMINWASQYQMPVHAVLTKADKLKKGAAMNQLLACEKSLARLVGENSELPLTMQLFSATKGTGEPELVQHIYQWLHPEG